MSGWQPGPVQPPDPAGRRRLDQQPSPRRAAASTAALDLTDGEWHRLHPATPLLKGGIVFVVILGIFVNNAREQLLQFFIPGPDGHRGGGGGDDGDPVDYVLNHGLIGLVLLGIAALLVVIIGIFYLSWRMNTFRVTAETVEVRSGIVFRTNRRARLDRIQGINIQRPILARVFGAAKLEINQAGHDANVPLAYLRSASADEVRSEILRRASGTREAANPQTGSVGQPGTGVIEQRLNEFLAEPLGEDGQPPQSVVHMHLGRLIGSAVLSGFTLFMVAIVVAVVVSIVTTGQYFLLFVFLPTILGSFSYYSRRIVKSLRYSITSTRDGIRIGWGLLSTSNETLPPGRIHSIRLSQPLMWRPFGWWEVKINRASHSSTKGADNQANTTILPVGSKDDVVRVLGLILPELVGLTAADVQIEDGLARGEFSAPEVVAAQPQRAVEESTRTLSLIEAGMTSAGSEGGFTTSPRRGQVLRWFSWRRNGFRTAPGALLLRKGAIWRQLVVVPLPRLQSVGVRQGPSCGDCGWPPRAAHRPGADRRQHRSDRSAGRHRLLRDRGSRCGRRGAGRPDASLARRRRAWRRRRSSEPAAGGVSGRRAGHRRTLVLPVDPSGRRAGHRRRALALPATG
ncbi:membrane protein [Frondihabitans sucicola]|uniref:Membrane protein n=1 Tax=Frondihabitans sucicola TaxID=1268041 RepID=A0ABM8GKT5_9MICO|nr:PH domain-containing protein [Frondihabitans sucicola]BDZ48823.1 membrane protein [Frondihabitans sucicola]